MGEADQILCLVVIDELDRFAPEGGSCLPDNESWQKNQLCPVLLFLHELVLTGVFPALVAMRSLNMESVKSGLTLCEFGTLGTWIGIAPPTLEAVNSFFRKAPAELIDSDHVNVEPMLLDALVEDAGSTPMGIPFVSETLRQLSEIDPVAEDISTADAGWAGGISEKYPAAAEGAVPDELDEVTLGELMLSLQRRVKSGSKKGETIFSTANYGELIQRSDLCRVFVDNLVNARVLHLTGNSLASAEIQWSVPNALNDWKRASLWLNEEDRRLSTAQRFEDKRSEWEDEDRTPVLLEHATHALNDARNLLAHHERRPFLSDEVIEFLHESLEIDERLTSEIKSEEMGGKLKKWGGVAAIVIVVLILIWAIFLR